MRFQLLAIVTVGAMLGVVVPRGQVRDAAAASGGTAIIAGSVVSDDVPAKAVGRAIVTVTGAASAARSAVTDDRGRFVLRNLPEDRYSIAAVRHGYVSGAYGARRAGRPGTPVMLRAGQTFEATVSMMPAGVVTGTIRDEALQPLPGLRVFAIDARRPASPAPVAASGRDGSPGLGSDTDDRGVYRIFDLPPGEYLIVATPALSVSGVVRRPSAADNDRLLALLDARATPSGSRGLQPAPSVALPAPSPAMTLAPVYFPGTPALPDAARVTVGRGEVRDGLDFVVRPVPVTSIDGIVVGPGGARPASVEVNIVAADTLEFFGLSGATPRLTHAPDADGRFTYSNIVPGRYAIVARGNSSAIATSGRGGIGPGGVTAAGAPAGLTTDADTVYAVERVEVTGVPVTGLALRLQRGSTVSGRVAFDSATQPAPTDVTGIRVTIDPSESAVSTGGDARIGSSFNFRQFAMLRADGTFEFPGIAPDAYRIVCTVPAAAGSGWWLRSAMVGAQDALDTALGVTLGTDVTNVVLTLTDRHSALRGTLQTPAGAPASDYFVVAMPADTRLRLPGTRRIASTRPGTDGLFTFADLPAGEYLLVALSDLEPGDLKRVEFLAEIAAAGVRVAMRLGETTTQNIRIEK